MDKNIDKKLGQKLRNMFVEDFGESSTDDLSVTLSNVSHVSSNVSQPHSPGRGYGSATRVSQKTLLETVGEDLDEEDDLENIGKLERQRR